MTRSPATVDEAWRRMITAIHASGRQAVVAITGGGSGAIAELLRVPGGSRLLLEAIVPYHARSLAAFLGATPAQACSAETAAALARRARERAVMLVPDVAVPIGLGATAALGTDRVRQGEDRCHIAVATGAAVELCSIVLDKMKRDRPAEEDLVARAIVLWLARGCGVAASSPRGLIAQDERYSEETWT